MSHKHHTKVMALKSIITKLSFINSSITCNNILHDCLIPQTLRSTQQTKTDTAQSNMTRTSNVFSTLLLLERKLLPKDMVMILDLFQVDVTCADIYLVLAQDINSSMEIHKVWVVKRLKEACKKMNNSVD